MFTEKLHGRGRKKQSAGNAGPIRKYMQEATKNGTYSFSSLSEHQPFSDAGD